MTKTQLLKELNALYDLHMEKCGYTYSVEGAKVFSLIERIAREGICSNNCKCAEE